MSYKNLEKTQAKHAMKETAKEIKKIAKEIKKVIVADKKNDS